MILVTGGTGYIGSQFVRTYCKQKPQEKVLVVDNLVEGHPEALEGLSNVVLEQLDIDDYDGLVRLFKMHDIRAVVHFAAFCYVGESQEDPGKYYQNNVAGSISLFRAMEDCGVRKLVFSSSCATYGTPINVPIDESHPQNPINVYGLTKHLVEQIIKGYADTRGWSYAALRYFNASGADRSGVFGESHDPETHIIPLALQVAAGKLDQLQIFGDDYDTPDGTCIRDYIHVEDLADAHIRALNKLEIQQGGIAINLGTTFGASVKEVVDVCQEVSGRKVKHVFSPRRPGDPARLVADATKAYEYLGWKPKHDLRSIIQTAWTWETNKRY